MSTNQCGFAYEYWALISVWNVLGIFRIEKDVLLCVFAKNLFEKNLAKKRDGKNSNRKKKQVTNIRIYGQNNFNPLRSNGTRLCVETMAQPLGKCVSFWPIIITVGVILSGRAFSVFSSMESQSSVVNGLKRNRIHSTYHVNIEIWFAAECSIALCALERFMHAPITWNTKNLYRKW